MNVATLGEANFERHGEYVSVVFNGQEFTNKQLLDEAVKLAAALRSLGVEPGDRVAVMLPNSPKVGTCYGAILRLGGVVVPMIFLLAVPEVHHILGDCRAKVIFTSPEFYPVVRAGIDGLTNPPVVVVTGDAPQDPGVLSYDALIASATGAVPVVDRDGEDLAVISYTSGTTGRPKGVMLTHANLLFNAENTSKVVPTRDGDTSILCLPLAHLFGLGASLVGQLFKIKGVLLPWFTAEGFFEAMNTYHPQSASLVPTMASFMLGHPDFDETDWSSLEWTVIAAAPVPVELADEFEKRTGARVLEGYGLTETSPTASIMRMEDGRRPGSCGKPVPNVEVAILDEDDHPVPVGEQGEVCIKGPNVMKGYYNLPEETEKALRNGWFHTGDVGKLDEDGFLYITERKKDMIIRGGFNIYPRDIEEVLYGHPAVQEAAVVGVPDATMGEEVLAYVVLRPGFEAHEEELLTLCRESLAKYKSPTWVRFIEVLPKNPVGKILKKDLRELAKAEQLR
ncbi:MAG TPA: long-chain-fatty-acid--CoA ligase [Actinomycetota bacterium]|nr:long-chain-fatty-acid--CoA ligase [Actinomycetota bacterium]